jgi:hypothetical protein
MRSLSLTVLILPALVVLSAQTGRAQSATTAFVPTEISTDLGTCSALITVTGIDQKPIYGAKITTRVH